MPQDRNTFTLGLTLIVALVLFCAAVVFVGGKSFEDREPIVVRIGHDQKVGRLKTGAPVICGPRQVGSITAVDLVEAPSRDDDTVRDFLYFEIHADVSRELALRTDCVIVAEGPLLGDVGQLRIVNRGTAAQRLTADTPVYARAHGFGSDWAMISRQFDEGDPSSLLSQIKNQLDPRLPASFVAKVHRSLGDINAITANLKTSVDPARKSTLLGKLDSILDHLNAVTAALRVQVEPGRERTLLAKVHRGLDYFDAGLKDLAETIAENRDGIRTTVDSARHAAAAVDRSIIPAVEAELDRTRAESLLARVHHAFDQINNALADADVVTNKARRVATLSEHRILTVIDNANEASRHLKAMAKDLRMRPWRLIHKPDTRETREAQLLDAVREFAEASVHLDESSKSLDALLEANRGGIPRDDPSLEAIRRQLDATLERFTAAEEALWNRLDLK